MDVTNYGPLLMGIVNVTPDSFSDGGLHACSAAAVAHGLRLLDEGADWLDIGGESTRPGAAAVDPQEQIRRVVPVIEQLHAVRPDVVISVDTSRATVARAALAAGASVVNDVTALSDPHMAALCAETRCDLVLMHMRGRPETMQRDTEYVDVVHEVVAYLAQRVAVAISAGVEPERLIVDPGVGFGKSFADNPRLIRAVPALKKLGHRVLIGASRKAFIGRLNGVSVPADRVHGSLGAALAAAAMGADIVRVHDVLATRRALTVFQAVLA
ncbi:MAG: dihydropteroate synthase [Kiritimatiellia bacterium]|jgi:dihydropteroate synthase